jgi:hypothetical protein
MTAKSSYFGDPVEFTNYFSNVGKVVSRDEVEDMACVALVEPPIHFESRNLNIDQRPI